ncbi:SDR family NAD(P)-dependent oxidoreductase [Streptomyces sp. NPDC058701]|uniref:SDR family NAD(P)-dependent oxidoreductase n=1 Tax=Streptomyces sp. NPDC058701 TaxID=3346608 RepID=UPI00364FBB18
MRLEGKVALVSGTAQGHGRAAALRFAAEGALVVAGDPIHQDALDTQRLIARAGGTALAPAPLDVTDEGSVRSWVDEAVGAFGGIDIVYVTTGSVRFGDLGSRPYDNVARTMGVQLNSVWPTVRATWPHLVRSRGCVLTVCPTTGPTASPLPPRAARSASRGSLVALTQQLATEGAPYGVRANCVSSGRPEDAVSAALFLVSDEAADITGANVVVDGAWSCFLPGVTP